MTVTSGPITEVDGLESFEEAFDDSGCSAVRDCACGRTFYDNGNEGFWSWEEGEQDKLAANPKATALPHGVEMVIFEGAYYVKDCTCWRPRAARIIAWLQAHQHAIAKFLTLEKKRKQYAADRSPVVE